MNRTHVASVLRLAAKIFARIHASDARKQPLEMIMHGAISPRRLMRSQVIGHRVQQILFRHYSGYGPCILKRLYTSCT